MNQITDKRMTSHASASSGAASPDPLARAIDGTARVRLFGMTAYSSASVEAMLAIVPDIAARFISSCHITSPRMTMKLSTPATSDRRCVVEFLREIYRSPACN